MAANFLKTLGLGFSFLLISAHGYSQYKTNVTITDVNNQALKERMQNNAGKLLSELNLAFFENRKPAIDNAIMTSDAGKSILAFWEMSMFRCYETQIIEKGLQLKNKYEVRNIPVFIKEAAKGKNYEETVLVFNPQGLIDDIYISVGTNRVNEILRNNSSVTDLRRRQIIVDFVENFRTAYNRKDIDFLNKVFSNDALIITGKIVKVQSGGSDLMMKNFNSERVIYQKQTKTEYMDKMKKVFNSNSYINIKFDSIEVVSHDLYPELFGVTLKQSWNTSRYSDEGYVFLMIDFKDEENPIIHVRTWQPEKVGGKLLPKDDVFSLESFGKLNR